jgi:hypothetical protein
MLTVKAVGWEEVAEYLEDRFDAFREEIEQGARDVGEGEAKYFRDEQLSGRDAMDMHLNVRRGVTRAAVQSQTQAWDALISSVVFTPSGIADHITLHQSGTTKLKKRLTLDEHFETEGYEAYHMIVEKALERLAA